MKYEYDVDRECFRREDNRGNLLMFNITEAKKIESLLNLGYPISQIYRKLDWCHDVNENNLRTFVKNLQKGNIDLSGDYPVPKAVFEDLTIDSLEDRIAELERKVKNHEDIISELRDDCFVTAFAADSTKESKSIIDEVKGWIRGE